jgi:hypothetical protein
MLNVSTGPHNKTSDSNIQILNSTMDCGSNGSLNGGARHGNTAIQVRGGSQNVTLEGDLITNCTTGFASVAQDNRSSNISLTYSTLEDLSGDAIDLGGLENVTIDHDLIDGAYHAGPEQLWHNDGIQFYGNTNDVAITNNVIANSGGQLLFIQDAIKSNLTGSSVNSNILVQNNLLYGAGAYAVQDQGAQNASFLNNTIWDSHFGGLLVRQSGYTGLVPTSTTIVGNVLAGYGTQNVVPVNEHNNLIAGYISPKIKAMVSPTDLLDATPTFVDPASGNFQLEGVTPAPVVVKGAGKAAGKALTTQAAAAPAAPTMVPSTLGSTITGAFGAPLFGV